MSHHDVHPWVRGVRDLTDRAIAELRAAGEMETGDRRERVFTMRAGLVDVEVTVRLKQRGVVMPDAPKPMAVPRPRGRA